jgi:hypothetical protein
MRSSAAHCPKTEERKFNLGVLNLYETHFIALVGVKLLRFKDFLHRILNTRYFVY